MKSEQKIGYGKIAYDAYRQCLKGRGLVPWKLLNQNEQVAWVRAAKEVLKAAPTVDPRCVGKAYSAPG